MKKIQPLPNNFPDKPDAFVIHQYLLEVISKALDDVIDNPQTLKKHKPMFHFKNCDELIEEMVKHAFQCKSLVFDCIHECYDLHEVIRRIKIDEHQNAAPNKLLTTMILCGLSAIRKVLQQHAEIYLRPWDKELSLIWRAYQIGYTPPIEKMITKFIIYKINPKNF
jgi:hypothetical protein